MDALGNWGAVPVSFSASMSIFSLIVLAEVGDKSQRVCMTLAARYRTMPVMLGTADAFLVLNGLAVAFAAAVAAWAPGRIMSAVVILLFAGFGLSILSGGEGEESAAVTERMVRGVLLTAAMLILVPDFGDKTELAVAGLAGSVPPWSVWWG